jgi:alpha-N-acetylglucosamine transferase
MKRYITLCNSEKYLKGTLVMYESLNATGTNIPLVVFCPKKTPENVRQILRNYAGISVHNSCKLEILESEEDIVLPKEITENNKWLRWNGTFDKLLIFGLSQYEKLVFIDSDMLVEKNLDHLFEHPHMSACFDGHYDKTNLNSGLMVVEPTANKAETTRIISFISSVIHYTQFGDQDIIRLAFPEWKTNAELHLSEQYNLFFENAARKKKESDYDLSDDAENPIYIIHFIGYDKPWYTGKKFKWKIYNWVWKTKMCLHGKREYKNTIVKQILKQYRHFLKITNRKLNRLAVTIYEMV